MAVSSASSGSVESRKRTDLEGLGEGDSFAERLKEEERCWVGLVDLAWAKSESSKGSLGSSTVEVVLVG